MPRSLKSREEWEKALRDYGCKPLEGKGALNTAEWWRMAWGGYPFTVPVDEEGRCDVWAFNRLVVDIFKLAPPDWQPPTDPEEGDED